MEPLKIKSEITVEFHNKGYFKPDRITLKDKKEHTIEDVRLFGGFRGRIWSWFDLAQKVQFTDTNNVTHTRYMSVNSLKKHIHTDPQKKPIETPVTSEELKAFFEIDNTQRDACEKKIATLIKSMILKSSMQRAQEVAPPHRPQA